MPNCSQYMGLEISAQQVQASAYKDPLSTFLTHQNCLPWTSSLCFCLVTDPQQCKDTSSAAWLPGRRVLESVVTPQQPRKTTPESLTSFPLLCLCSYRYCGTTMTSSLSQSSPQVIQVREQDKTGWGLEALKAVVACGSNF